MPRAEIRALQLKKLQHTVKWSYDRVPYYHKIMEESGVTPDQIKSLDDVRRLPFTTKADLRDNYPFGLFAVPKKEIVEIHASSGTTGKPIVGGYTRRDLDVWSDCVARLAVAAGATSDDISQIAFGYGLFTGAFGLHYALEKIGSMVVTISSGNSEKQIMLMKDFETTLLVATPSYAVYLSELAKDMGVADQLKLRLGLFGSEVCTTEMRDQIERNIGIIVIQRDVQALLRGSGHDIGTGAAADHTLGKFISRHEIGHHSGVILRVPGGSRHQMHRLPVNDTHDSHRRVIPRTELVQFVAGPAERRSQTDRRDRDPVLFQRIGGDVFPEPAKV